MRYLAKQKGIALPMAFALACIFFIMMVGLLSMISNGPKMTTSDLNYMAAKYVAEAGAKYGLVQAKSSLWNGTNPGAISGSVTNIKLSDTSPLTVSVSWAPDSTTSPTKIVVTATATSTNMQYQALVDCYLGPSPVIINGQVADLIQTGIYSHADYNPEGNAADQQRWQIVASPAPLHALPTQSNCQVMFNDIWNNKIIDVYYNASAYVPGGTTTGGGYGIYYGMIGNADDLNSYVLQWDPGAQYDKSDKYSSSTYYAQYGTLLVKKVIMANNVYATTSNYASNFTTNTGQGPGNYEINDFGDSSGNNSNYYALPFEAPNTGDVLRIPLASSDDYNVNAGKSGQVGQNQYPADGTSLQTLMNNYLAANGGGTFDLSAVHTIHIQINSSTTPYQQSIYVDNNPTPILTFKDHSSNYAANYKLDGVNQNFTGTHTGVRVWSNTVQIDFTNSSNPNNNQQTYQMIIWR